MFRWRIYRQLLPMRRKDQKRWRDLDVYVTGYSSMGTIKQLTDG